MAFILSDSLTLSSSAPLISVIPSAWVARTHNIGNSSMREGIESFPILTALRSPAVLQRMSATGSPETSLILLNSTTAPISFITSSNPVLVGFIPTPLINTSEPGTITAAAMKNAAEEKSEGTVISSDFNSLPPSSLTVSPSTLKSAPIAPSILSVWSLDRYGSAIDVRPSAYSPARTRHDLTCADATGIL